MSRTSPTRPRTLVTSALASTVLLAGLTAAPPAASAATTVPLYAVVQQGLLPAQADELADRAGVGPALLPDGSFSYVGDAYLKIPDIAGESKTLPGDEDEGRVVADHVDLDALAELEVLDPGDALALAGKLLPDTGPLQPEPIVDHSLVDVADRNGKLRSSHPIDTTVTFRFSLADRPVVGPGAKQRIAFDGDGRVTQLSRALPTLEHDGDVEVISAKEALAQCVALAGKGVAQDLPELVYFAPQPRADEADGGTDAHLVPHYACRDRGAEPDEDVQHLGRLVPAAPKLTPTVDLEVRGDGKRVVATASATGGAEPHTVNWSSTSGDLSEAGDDGVSYVVGERRPDVEVVTVEVVDANGVVATTSVALDGAAGQGAARGSGGAGGAFAEVGIEQTVDEWQCAQDSADGFHDEMEDHGQTVDFDWRGANAWEQDFKRVSAGGTDTDFVDEVDIQWYTGHGSPNSFTFKGTNDDTRITPSDARWGDTDLEWMQLESCQVLRDTNGAADYFARWAPAFRGLHLLNGFDTNAFCIGGGTGERFAELLFPQTFFGLTVRPALTVQQAWATMANELEPAGVRWRTISPMQGSVSNMGDFYHGQGPVGPDISASERTGFISISGVS